MGNCLVTKLKESVDTDLPKVGELVLHVESGSFNVRARNFKSFTVRTEKAILSLTNGGPYTKEVTISNTDSSVMIPIYLAEDANVYLSNKYDSLGRIESSKIIGDLDLNYSDLNNLGAGGLPNLDTLTINSDLASLYAKVQNIVIPSNYVPGTLTTMVLDPTSNASSITTEIVTLKFPNIAVLQGPENNFLGGDIANLGRCSSLSSISGGEYSGTLEGFVAAACAFASKTTGSVGMKYIPKSTFYKDSMINTGSTEKTLAWVPSGNNISITFNSESTVIHVNSDGTWTRVS